MTKEQRVKLASIFFYNETSKTLHTSFSMDELVDHVEKVMEDRVRQSKELHLESTNSQTLWVEQLKEHSVDSSAEYPFLLDTLIRDGSNTRMKVDLLFNRSAIRELVKIFIKTL